MSKQDSSRDQDSRTHRETKTRLLEEILLVQNQGLNPGIQSRDAGIPGLAFFNPGILKGLQSLGMTNIACARGQSCEIQTCREC